MFPSGVSTIFRAGSMCSINTWLFPFSGRCRTYLVQFTVYVFIFGHVSVFPAEHPVTTTSPSCQTCCAVTVLCCPNSFDITNMTENAKNMLFHTGCADVRYHIRHLFLKILLSVCTVCLSLFLVYQSVIACVLFCACVCRWTWSLKARFTSVFPSLDPSLMVSPRMHVGSFPSCINKTYLWHYRTYNACPPLNECIYRCGCVFHYDSKGWYVQGMVACFLQKSDDINTDGMCASDMHMTF